jgi:hypothetical protein
MSKNNDEQYLDFLRYQELKPATVTRRDEKWMNSKDAKREVKAQAKEDKRRGRR